MSDAMDLKAETPNKATKKTLDTDESTSKNRKISDFFKTPDKNINHKQKSLLQFFTKNTPDSPAEKKNQTTEDKINEKTNEIVVNGEVSEVEILTPNSSDKENAESITDEPVSEIIEDSKHNNGQSKNGDMSGKTIKLKEIIEKERKHKKHKKKKKIKEEEESLILISDTSCSLPGTQDEVDGTGEHTEAGKSVTVNEDDKVRSESSSANNNEGTENKSKADKGNDNDYTENKGPTCEETEPEEVKPKKINKRVNESKQSNLGKNHEVEVCEQAEDTNPIGMEEDTATDNESRAAKKNLRVMEMMNLLKEIKDTEKDTSKKKKHKKKHKHKNKYETDKETHEISCTDDIPKESNNENCNDNGSGESATLTDKKSATIQDTGSENKEPEKQDELHQVEEKEKLNGKELGLKEVVNLERATSQETENELPMKHKKERKIKHIEESSTKKSATKHKKKMKKANGAKLSYEVFTQDLESKEKGADNTLPKEENGNAVSEMSYTEYLEKLEKSMTEETGEVSQTGEEEKNVVDEKEDHIKAEVTKDIAAAEEVLESNRNIPEKIGLKNFFTVMTSTPDKPRKKSNAKSKSKEIINDDLVDCKKNAPKQKNVKSKNKDETDNDTVEIVSVEEKKANEQNKSSLPSKKKQATLSFGKTGLTVSKPVPKVEETTEQLKPTEGEEKTQNIITNADITKVPKKRGRPKKAETILLEEAAKNNIENKCDTKPSKIENGNTDLNVTDNEVFVTPAKVRKKGSKRKVDICMEDESTDDTDRRRSQRKRYKVEAFQMDADRRTPIKIKLKRCPKSSSSGDDPNASELKVRKQKHSTAQALLMKAKKGRPRKYNEVIKNRDKIIHSKKPKVLKKKRQKTKERSESNSSEDSICRRSSRLEGRKMASMEEVSLENIIISSDADSENESVAEHSNLKKKNKLKKKMKQKFKEKTKKLNEIVDANKATPKKGTPKKKLGTPLKNKKSPTKKPGMKLAPMFMMGKNKAAQESPKKPPLNPEQAEQRQQFLMSGVPDELKKQTATRIASTVAVDYPPLPTLSHVQQIPQDTETYKGQLNVWHMKHLELKVNPPRSPIVARILSRFTGDLLSKFDGVDAGSLEIDLIKTFCGHAELSEAVVDQCLAEISNYNPGFPVHSMYKSLKYMKTETEKPPPKSESMLKTDMSGILADCTDMVVIDDDDDDRGKRGRKKKKKLKIQKKELVEEVKKEETATKQPCPSLLWTEKYCPARSSDVIGNTGTVKKLKNWLSEWKHVLDREAKKARKLLMKKNKGKKLSNKKVDDDVWDDDSDFDMDSDDSEEDESLCNTVLLSGPHGCGKTSTVYALALELGFKVHEVNTSSCRSGRQILSQLQEATQSHQVSSQGSHTPRKNTALGGPVSVAKQDEKSKSSAAFTNLFKKSSGPVQTQPTDKEGSKKRKRNKSDKDESPKSKRRKDEKLAINKKLQMMMEDSSSQSAAAKSLNLSSTTLILFDEADVVFEEDRGFLSAIQTFMSNTKIPIILTTADKGFTNTFDGRYEQMSLKRPTVGTLSTYLQTVALVENVRTDPHSLSDLVHLHNSDVRQCVISLQYDMLSGGATKHTFKTLPLVTNNGAQCLGVSENGSLNGGNSLNSGRVEENVENRNSVSKTVENNDDDDFVTLKPFKKRRHFFEDDNSNSVDKAVEIDLGKHVVNDSDENDTEARKCPQIHCIGKNLEGNVVSQGLNSQSVDKMISVTCCLKDTSVTHVFYNNLHVLLPVMKCQVVDKISCTVRDTCKKVKNRKRIKMDSDLYDSEASNDATKPEDANCDTTEDVSARDSTQESKDSSKDSAKDSSKDENRCLAKTLSKFSTFYDTVSFLDLMNSSETMGSCDKLRNTGGKSVKGSLVAGMENEFVKFVPKNKVDSDCFRAYSSEIETRSVYKMYSEIEAMENKLELLSEQNPVFAENFILPVLRHQDQFTVCDRSSVSVPSEFRRACENTVDNLPLTIHSQLRTVHVDYLPTVREICRTERSRLLANTKRRFHHYLDSISLPLKEKTIGTFASSFT